MKNALILLSISLTFFAVAAGCGDDNSNLPKAGQVGTMPSDPTVRANIAKAQGMHSAGPSAGAKMLPPDGASK